MNNLVATEPAEKPATHSHLETWGKNERMRHIPSVEWIVWKLDYDLRRRIDKLLVSFAGLPADDPHHGPIETELRALCRAVDRFSDTIRHHRGNHAPQDLSHHIAWSISQAASGLHSLDAALFGRRYPFQTFERSKGEVVYGALMVILEHIGRVTTLVRAVDPSIDAHLLEDLVKLEQPMRETPMA